MCDRNIPLLCENFEHTDSTVDADACNDSDMQQTKISATDRTTFYPPMEAFQQFSSGDPTAFIIYDGDGVLNNDVHLNGSFSLNESTFDVMEDPLKLCNSLLVGDQLIKPDPCGSGEKDTTSDIQDLLFCDLNDSKSASNEIWQASKPSQHIGSTEPHSISVTDSKLMCVSKKQKTDFVVLSIYQKPTSHHSSSDKFQTLILRSQVYPEPGHERCPALFGLGDFSWDESDRQSCGDDLPMSPHSLAGPPSPPAPSQLACSHCGKVFRDNISLRKHLPVHGPKAHVCSACGRSFIGASKLKRHSLVHSGERPHACDHPGCNKRFSLLHNLHAHRRVHTGDRPFVCPEPGCAMQFTQRANLNTHRRAQHQSEAD